MIKNSRRKNIQIKITLFYDAKLDSVSSITFDLEFFIGDLFFEENNEKPVTFATKLTLCALLTI
ncbi:hypothetical protein CSB62_12965 [Vibrio splendidus]|uniref:Uncharacterized protein n=1 Tax=Vibrio lentus TaxID=136468 RepID=A0A4U2FHZ1_9VIBR|nr:hypothetical protein CSB62_12965 [Vibrio splendidus]TKF43361.1 hypothetical protein FCV64_15260 [Vibrio lentus]TKF53741.1 hypothetical protein FCV63_17905 [Vibrio lentus]TKF93905.1 hypothetical protein FCV71_23460 [Vibrio lentus]TKG02956.1 hypothetical protein FCV91_22025 [Vibrio lentus]